MEPSEILLSLFDSKIISILKLFLREEGKQLYLREIAKQSRVSPASTCRILKKLTALQILRMTEIKTVKLYTLEQGKTTDFIKSLLEVDVIQYFTDKASRVHGIEEILMMGKDKAKANLLLLGHGVDTMETKTLCAEIKEKFSFTINTMTLTREQYEQMFAMGLYPGTKKVLFRKT